MTFKSAKQRKRVMANIKKGGVKKEQIRGYDVKAKKSVIMINPMKVKMKNGRMRWKGKSPLTGIEVSRII